MSWESIAEIGSCASRRLVVCEDRRTRVSTITKLLGAFRKQVSLPEGAEFVGIISSLPAIPVNALSAILGSSSCGDASAM